MLWDERLEEQYDVANVNSQDVQVYFFDVDDSAEAFGLRDVDAKVPYARINLTQDEEFDTTINHMVSAVLKNERCNYCPYPDLVLIQFAKGTAAPSEVSLMFFVRERRGGS